MSKFYTVATFAACSSADWTGQIQWGGRCVDVADGKPPYILQLWDCHDESHADYKNQIFDSNGYYISGTGGGTITGLSYEDGAVAVMGHECDAIENDCWNEQGSGYSVIITNGYSCLDVKDGQNHNGAPLQLWKCAGNDNQNFHIQKPFALVAPLASGNSVRGNLAGQIQWGGRCVDVRDRKYPYVLQLWDCHDVTHENYPNQLFENSGNYLHGVGGSITGQYGVQNGAVAVTGCQEDCFNSNNDFEGSIKITNGYYCLDVKDGQNFNGAGLQLWECEGNSNQVFHVLPGPATMV